MEDFTPCFLCDLKALPLYPFRNKFIIENGSVVVSRIGDVGQNYNLSKNDFIDFLLSHGNVTLPAEFFCGQCSFHPSVSAIDFLDIRGTIELQNSIIEKWRCEDAKREV